MVVGENGFLRPVSQSILLYEMLPLKKFCDLKKILVFYLWATHQHRTRRAINREHCYYVEWSTFSRILSRQWRFHGIAYPFRRPNVSARSSISSLARSITSDPRDRRWILGGFLTSIGNDKRVSERKEWNEKTYSRRMLETPETQGKKLSTATRMNAFKNIMRINRALFRMNCLWMREYINLIIILKK